MSPSEPHLWWSASEDGTVRQFDRRLPGQKTPSSPNVLATLPSPGGRRVEAKGLCLSAAAPHLLAVACGDPFVRLFDRRRLGLGPPGPGPGPGLGAGGSEAVLKLAPPHLPVGEWLAQ